MPTKELKLCIDCFYYWKHHNDYCTHPLIETIDLVTGKKVYPLCITERSGLGGCKKDAILHVKKKT